MTKTAAITGSASGIGLTATQRLLAEGWTVHGLDRADQTDPRGGFKPVWRDIDNEAKDIKCGTLKGGTVCYGDVTETGVIE